MIRVVLESPYKGDVAANVAYAKRALLDSLSRGEAPIASHLLHTQVLDDTDARQRLRGISAGLAWVDVAHRVALYCDRGISEGMVSARNYAQTRGVEVEHRWMDGERSE